MKLTDLIVFIFSAYIADAYFVEDESVCRENYVPTLPTEKIGRKCYYYLLTNKVNWFTASHYCIRHHMRLATFDNEEENTLMGLYLNGSGPLMKIPVEERLLWSSGNSLSYIKEWFWMHLGRRIDFFSWKANEPKDGQNGERCIAVTIENATLVWSAEKCERKLGFICEHSYARIGF